jgi:hypothetical protein
MKYEILSYFVGLTSGIVIMLFLGIVSLFKGGKNND